MCASFFQDIPNGKLSQRTVDVDFESNKVSEIKIIPPSIPIERLSLRKNNISNIQNGAFEALTYISYIDLSYNNLEDLKREVFRGPKRPGKGTPSPILSLDLSYNKIESLSRIAFEYLINLEEINLSGNPLKLMNNNGHGTATAIGSLTSLIYLNLSETGIDAVPRHFFKGKIF